jgi:hypothetical protein
MYAKIVDLYERNGAGSNLLDGASTHKLITTP